MLFWWRLATLSWGLVAVFSLLCAWHLFGVDEELAMLCTLVGCGGGFVATYSWRQWSGY